jgi:hypothetical protein
MLVEQNVSERRIEKVALDQLALLGKGVIFSGRQTARTNVTFLVCCGRYYQKQENAEGRPLIVGMRAKRAFICKKKVKERSFAYFGRS